MGAVIKRENPKYDPKNDKIRAKNDKIRANKGHL